MKNDTGSREPNNTSPYADLLLQELPSDYRMAAHFWLEFDFTPIPLVPGKKVTAVPWSWTDNLDHEKIDRHWAEHPDHEIGAIVDERVFVIDADGPAAVAALYSIENALDVSPNLIVKTKKGEHHYFRRATGSYARMDSHSTELHPDRVDVRTGRGHGKGRSMIVLPPSLGKAIVLNEADSVADLTVATQALIDAVAIHNGREPPRIPVPKIAKPGTVVGNHSDSEKIRSLLRYVPSQCGYQDWVVVLMALHHTFKGSDEGLAIADQWSSTANNYCGTEELEYKWRTFDGYGGTPITLGTLCKMAAANGADIAAILGNSGENFGPTETIVVDPSATSVPELARFTLTGRSAEFEAKMLKDVFVLGMIALLGQLTVLFAKTNTGKTVLILWMLIQSIRRGIINPSDVYYVNADDSHAGLTQKLKIAEEFGFHMIAPGYLDFNPHNLLDILQRLCKEDKARGVILILDTLKKFTDVMDKKTATRFGSILREFGLKGGTVVMLAHVNKNAGKDGKPVYAGTTDIIDDSDCGYILDVVANENGKKIVQFENIKSRGRVVNHATYSYSTEEGISYLELLASVEVVEDAAIVALQGPNFAIIDDTEDQPLIEAVKSCIREGINTKMKLAHAAARRCGASERKALRVLERYTGTGTEHHWSYTLGQRGANQFRLPE